MKSTTQIGRRTWVLLAISLALLGAVHTVRKLRPVARPDADTTLSALRTECSALAVPDVLETARWRARQTALGSQKWTEPARRAFGERIGPRWRWAELTASAACHHYRLTAAAAANIPWSEVVATVATLETTPGLIVEAIEVRTKGTRSTRTFSAVEIRVGLQWDKTGPENTVPPESVRRDRVSTMAGLGGTSRERSGPVRAQPPVRLRPPPATRHSFGLRLRAPAPVRSALRPARPPAARPGMSGNFP